MKHVKIILIFLLILFITTQLSGQINNFQEETLSGNYSGDEIIEKGTLDASEEITYCEATGNANEELFSIEGVIIGSINNTGTGNDGYHDYTDMSTDLYPGQTNVSVEIQKSCYKYCPEKSAWIDWNRDGDFLDANENIYCDKPFFNVPDDAVVGKTRMRIRTQSSPETEERDVCISSCGPSNVGEVEDYTINIITPDYPVELKVENITYSSGNLCWLQFGNVINWQIRLGTKGFDTTGVIPVLVDENPYRWSNLSSDTQYDWYIRAGFGDGNYSSWVGPSTFKTLREGILMSNTYGGSSGDFAYSIHTNNDGGYVIAGYTESFDYDVHGYHGNGDFWVVKTNQNGDTIWTKALGGSNKDFARDITQTIDGFYIVTGETFSNDFDVNGNHGSDDCWVVKLNDVGDTIWTKTLGGSGYEYSHEVTATADGGCIVAATTNSNDGDVPFVRGASDYWIIKLDNYGEITWSKTYGGTGYESANSVAQTADGGYIVSGVTYSNNGDVIGNHGHGDFWIIKLDDIGNLLWSKTVGGSQYEYESHIIQTFNGDYIIVGATNSTDGDAIGNHGSWDYLVAKLDGFGNIQWSKTFGGSNSEESYSVIQTIDGNFVVAGYSYSSDGDVPENMGIADYCIVKFDGQGNIFWSKNLGGSGDDNAQSIVQTSTNNLLVAGFSKSNDNDVYGNHGNGDFWIVELDPDYFETFTNSGQNLGTSGATDVALGDMDGDGDLDAVVTKDGEGEPNIVYLNHGDGTFFNSGLSFGNNKSWAVALGDLDGDGDLDGFVANDGHNKVYLNNGPLTTDNGQSLGNRSSRDVDLGDVDGDGDLDAVVANNAEGQPNTIYLNKGNGIFFNSGMYFGTEASYGIALGDIDQDGDLDGFVANQGPNKVYLNNGASTTDNGQSLGNSSSRDVKLGDMDGDGDLDAVVANDAAGEPNKVWLNNTYHDFFNSGLNFGNEKSMSLALGDLDGDGDLDGFVANDGPNKIYLNEGAATTDNCQSLGNSNSYGVALGDLDGDGDLDAFVANYDGPCKIWINQSPPQPEKQATAQSNSSSTLSQFSVDNPKWENAVLLDNYPNPFSRSTTVRFKTNTTERVVLRVTSLYGTVVEKLNDATAQAEQKYKIDFQSKDLPAGIYVIQLETENGLKAHTRMMLIR